MIVPMINHGPTSATFSGKIPTSTARRLAVHNAAMNPSAIKAPYHVTVNFPT
jgi:hypothetical protein